MANPNSKAPINSKSSNVAEDYSTWTDIQIGFAPYWHPEADKFFVGTPIARDERNPEFIRYLILAAEDTMCQRGPNDDSAEKVMVKKGECFSISVYHQLAEEFDFQLESGVGVPIRIDALKKAKTKSGQDVWNFRARCHPNHTKMLADKRSEWRAARLPSAPVREQLEA